MHITFLHSYIERIKMKKQIVLFVSFLIFNFTYITASNDLTSQTTQLTEVFFQYRWFDSAENRKNNIAPKRWAIPSAATNHYQRIHFSLFLNSSQSVSEMLSLIQAILGVPMDNLRIRLGNNRKDRVIDIPFSKMTTNRIKIRYVEPKDDDE